MKKNKLSEEEKREIKKQAKEIIGRFEEQLSKVDFGNLKKEILEDGERKENTFSKIHISKKIMFENAPEKKGNYILAEKKKW